MRTKPAIAGEASLSDAANSHKLLSCNIRVDLDEDYETGNGWKERRELCAEVIAAQDADVIGLQECRSHQLADLLRHLPDFDRFGQSQPEPLYHPANAILFSRSRYELITAGGFWLSKTPHVAGSKSWDSARSRFVNWVYLLDRQSQQPLRVWNAHLDHVGQLAREQQTRLILEAAAAFPDDAPQVLMGDFNADRPNQAVALVLERGWIDSYAAVHGPQDPGNTFHRFLGPAYADAMHGKRFKGKIDWIFVRGGIQVLDSEIIRDGRQGRYPSDHYFVSATIQLDG